MRIFVTGGGGFVGSTWVAQMRAQGHEVVAPGRDQLDLTDARALAAVEGDFDRIVHLAAWTQAGDWCLTHQGEQWICNQHINTNVLAWWQERHLESLMIAMGTSCSYEPGVTLDEEMYMLGQPIESLYTYALTKRMLLQGLKAITQQYGGRFLYLVPSTLYGPGYRTDGRQMHFIFDLIRKILRGKAYGDPVVLWGDGYQRRELVHIDDFIINAENLVDCGASGVFNLGAGVDFSIREFAEVICEVVGYDKSKILYSEEGYTGAQSKLLSTEKARLALETYAQRDSFEGIRGLVAWFKQCGAYS